jgi:hypothetical protein
MKLSDISRLCDPTVHLFPLAEAAKRLLGVASDDAGKCRSGGHAGDIVAIGHARVMYRTIPVNDRKQALSRISAIYDPYFYKIGLPDPMHCCFRNA